MVSDSDTGERMRIDIECNGLLSLLEQVEKLASDDEIAKVNKKIITRSEPVVKNIMKEKMPKSADISHSGRGFGSKSSVSEHAADAIPIGNIKMQGTVASTSVGWEKSDTSEHFYVKFINWGTIYQPPREFIFATGREADDQVTQITEQEYQRFLDQTIKQ